MFRAGNNPSVGDGLNTTGYSLNARSYDTRDNLEKLRYSFNKLLDVEHARTPASGGSQFSSGV
jgi:hypothetical protein